MKAFEERRPVQLENHHQKIFGIFHKPLNVKHPYPAVLICHGLAGNKVGKYRVYVEMAEQLSRAGIASLRIDVRGSGDSEGLFSDSTVEGQVEDSALGLSFLANHSEVDKNRLGSIGRSFGGMLSIMAANRSKLIKALALWVPFFDAHPWKEQWSLILDQNVPSELIREQMIVEGQLGGMPFFEQFFKIDAKKELAGVSSLPLLHIEGANDARISAYHTEKYREARKEALGETRYLTLPNSDHDFTNLEERFYVLKETVKWFQEML